MIKDLKEKIKDYIDKKKRDKYIFKQREKYHKEVLEKEKQRANEPRIAPNNSFISLVNINKIYPNHVQAVFDFNLDIDEHDFVVFVGPSGCGKSTTLRMIAGLEDITSGDLYMNGEYSNNLTTKERDIAMVFQSYALYPHMTVYQNMAFGLKINHVSKEEIKERVLKAAEILQITEYLDRKPDALSGGQCQRVALGRAIVRNSNLFLMDEPLSNLDAKLRVSMRGEIVKLHERLKATTIYVTHDQTEAMTMATKIVIMNKGYIQQIGKPSEIYSKPANLFVATFIGSPAMNVLDATLNKDNLTFKNNFSIKVKSDFFDRVKDFYDEELNALENKLNAKIDVLYEAEKNSYLKKNKELTEDEIKELIKNEHISKDEDLIEISQTINSIIETKGKESYSIKIGIRPENILLNEDKNSFESIVTVSELLGSEYYLHFDFSENEEIVVKASTHTLISRNDKLKLSFREDDLLYFDPITTKRIF